MIDSRSKILKSLVTPISKTIIAIALKLLSAIGQPSKVGLFDGFVNQSIITYPMIHKTSFYENLFLLHADVSKYVCVCGCVRVCTPPRP